MDPEVKVFDGGTAVGYVRVSRCGTDDQTGVLAQERSIAAQKQAITGYAETHGMQIVAWHVDVGQGRDLPGLGQLMGDAGSLGRGFDIVLVYSRSRLSRNGVNLFQIMLELREAGVTVVSVTGPFVDMSVGAGRFVLDMIEILNEHHRAVYSEATRRGVAAARRRREGC